MRAIEGYVAAWDLHAGVGITCAASREKPLKKGSGEEEHKPQNEETPLSLEVPHAPFRSRTSTALALPVPICTRLRNKTTELERRTRDQRASQSALRCHRSVGEHRRCWQRTPKNLPRAPSWLRSSQAVEDPCCGPGCGAASQTGSMRQRSARL